MKQFLRTKIAICGFLIALFAVPLAPVSVSAAAQQCGAGGFTLLPPWYKGLEKGCSSGTSGTGGVKSPAEYGKGLDGWILKIALNIIEALLYVTGYASLGFIIWGGMKFMLYGDNSQGVASARKTIQNAIIGLVISLFAVAIVNVISGAF